MRSKHLVAVLAMLVAGSDASAGPAAQLIAKLLNECPASQGMNRCKPGQALGAGLVCPPPPSNVPSTPVTCHAAITGDLIAEVKTFAGVQATVDLRLAITGQLKRITHTHTADPERSNQSCASEYTAEEASLDMSISAAVSASAGTGGGTPVNLAEVNAALAASLGFSGAPYCGQAPHPEPTSCKRVE